jgi:hypothetical protein
MTWPVTTRRGGERDTKDFEEYRNILTAIYDLAGRGAAVDLGCGEAQVTRDWGMCTLVDSVRAPQLWRTIEKMDMRQAPATFAKDNRRFNLLIMTDSIEHLTKEDGFRLLTDMAPLCKATVIFTPVGAYKMDVFSTDPDVHKSGWLPEEFERAGWSVWEWSNYHPDVGAFWAWKWADGKTPTVEEVAAKAGVEI